MKETKCMWLDLCREELLLLREEADKKISELEGQCQELQSVIQQVSEDFQKVSYGFVLHILTIQKLLILFIHWLFDKSVVFFDQVKICFSVTQHGFKFREVSPRLTD